MTTSPTFGCIWWFEKEVLILWQTKLKELKANLLQGWFFFYSPLRCNLFGYFLLPPFTPQEKSNLHLKYLRKGMQMNHWNGKNIPTSRHICIISCHSDIYSSECGNQHPDNIPFSVGICRYLVGMSGMRFCIPMTQVSGCYDIMSGCWDILLTRIDYFK